MAADKPGAASNGGPLEPASEAGQSIAEHLVADNPTGTYALLMPEGFSIKEGEPLWEGVKLGKFLGAGAQAKVFQLARDDGQPTGKVIKVNHGGVGSKMLNNNVLWIGMDREWEIGTQLRVALQEPGGNVPGFMAVNDCLVSSSKQHAGFCGMIIGELHGWEVYKRIDTPEFHNIHYVREMLFQVCSALDRAQCKLGFLHADLGMRNVMEHYPRLWEDLPAEEAAKAKAAFHRPGFNVNADGSRMPLGPDLEFKIIDFGVAKFSPKLAAAAAGPEAQEVVLRLHEQLGKNERIIFGSDTEGTKVEFEQSDVTQEPSSKDKIAAMFNMRKSRLIVHRSAECAAKGVSMGVDVGAAIIGTVSSAALRLTSAQEAAYIRATKEEQKLKGGKRKKKKSPIEAMYRHFWHRKGDMFHLMLGMALALDDRVWPEEDEDEVQSLASLVHHITGVKMHARFIEAPASGPSPFGRSKWQHWFRRWHIRAKAHVIPYNSGLLAREALSHPFFGAGLVRHAELPIPLRTAFPPSGQWAV